MKKKLNRKGFTLVELLVVLAILGLLAALGVPQVVRTMNRARVGADVATIKTVQTAVNAFISEVGINADNIVQFTGNDAEDLIDTGGEINLDCTIDSIITGQPVTLGDLMDSKLVTKISGAYAWDNSHLRSFNKVTGWFLSEDLEVYVTGDSSVGPENPGNLPASVDPRVSTP